MSRTVICHGCHTILGNGAHQGSAIGKARCVMPHSLLCKGNIEETDSWRACPSGYVYNPDVEINSYTGFTDTLDPSVFQPGLNRRSTPSGSSQSLNGVISQTIVNRANDDRTVVNRNNSYQDQVIVGDAERERLERLSRQAAGEGARSKVVQPVISQNSASTDTALSGLPEHILAQIRDFRATNQQANEVRDRPTHSDFNITNLRSDEDLRGQVESGIRMIRDRVPSLAAAPTAQINNNEKRGPALIHLDQSEEQVDRYEWITDSRGKRHLVPLTDLQVPSRTNFGAVHARANTSQYGSRQEMSEHSLRQFMSETDSDPYKLEFRCSPQSGRLFQVKVPVKRATYQRETTVQQAYRIEYRCSPTTGRVWQECVPLNPHSPQRQTYHLEWRVHPISGETYQVEVPTTQSSCPQEARYVGRESLYTTPTSPGHFLNTQQAPHSQVNRSMDQSSGQNRNGVAGIYRLDKSSSKRQSRVVDLAKSCPVKWAKTTNSSSINLPLYIWGAIAELESSLSGRSNPMPDGELLGKMRHLKNIVEVCCLNSTSTDFSSYGWAIAKDYASKVEDEVAQNVVDWCEMHHGVRTSSLVSAQMDCPRQSFNKSSKTKETEKEKIICTTYNKCTTKGKCDYEVAHPDKSCQRKHECGWCRSNLNQGYKHQTWDCNKKKEASGSA